MLYALLALAVYFLVSLPRVYRSFAQEAQIAAMRSQRYDDRKAVSDLTAQVDALQKQLKSAEWTNQILQKRLYELAQPASSPRQPGAALPARANRASLPEVTHHAP